MPNRFFYNTILLPWNRRPGKIRSKSRLNRSTHGDDDHRHEGYYSAYTHTQAYIPVDGEQQGHKFKPGQNPDTMLPPDLTDAEKQALLDNYRQDHINLFNTLSGKSMEVPAVNYRLFAIRMN